jgi:hypothetical protein
VHQPLRRTTTAALLRAAAVVGLLAGSTVAYGGPAVGHARAAETICVALIVDFADLGNGVDSDCVKVQEGSSGEDVLRARHTLGFRPNQPGFVCTIDGWPQEGCAASNGEHYWAYFHRAPGSSSWTYSTAGASGYEPRANSTEGWVWLTRKDQTPADVRYSGICAATSSPSPRPTTTSRASGGGGGGGGGGGDAAGRTSTTGATDSADTAVAPTARSRSAETRAGSATDRQGHLSPPPTATTTTTPSPGATTTSAVAEPDATDGASSPPYGLVAGAVVIGGLGAAAVLRARRNRGTP